MRPTLVVMGFNKPTWAPGRERSALTATEARRLDGIRGRRDRHARDKVAARQLEGSLLSLAALLGSNVTDPDGNTIGKLRDVVVRWTEAAPYPRMAGIVVRMGKRDVAISARWLELHPPASVRLRSSKAYARAVERHPADVGLAHDVLDHQVVDSAGTQIIRPADVYLAEVDGGVEVVGIEVGVRALLRRLGPRVLRSRTRPQQVIDWRDIVSFAPARDEAEQVRGRRADIAGQPGTGLALGEAAPKVRRFRPSEVRDALQPYKVRDDGDAE